MKGTGGKFSKVHTDTETLNQYENEWKLALQEVFMVKGQLNNAKMSGKSNRETELEIELERVKKEEKRLRKRYIEAGGVVYKSDLVGLGICGSKRRVGIDPRDILAPAPIVPQAPTHQQPQPQFNFAEAFENVNRQRLTTPQFIQLYTRVYHHAPYYLNYLEQIGLDNRYLAEDNIDGLVFLQENNRFTGRDNLSSEEDTEGVVGEGLLRKHHIIVGNRHYNYF